jgi:hypothetical protein
MMKDRLISMTAFAILAGLWLVFAAALVFNPSLLDAAWQTLRGWPLVVQAVIWLLALPVTLGLWIWQMPWPVLLRLALVAGLACATVYTFFPWKNRVKSAAASA